MPHCFLTKQTEKLQEFFLKKYDHPDSCHSLSVTQMLFFLHIQAPTSVPCWADQNMPAWALRCTSSSLPCTLTLVWTPLTAPRRPLRLGEVKCQGVLNEKWQVWLFFFSCKAFSCCCCFFFAGLNLHLVVLSSQRYFFLVVVCLNETNKMSPLKLKKWKRLNWGDCRQLCRTTC